jgi:c-di-AMP phosphodiesterase-like protein
MKSRLFTIWALCLLLAIASVDTLPDPPAVSPRTFSGISFLSAAGADLRERQLNSDLSISSFHQVRWIAFTSTYEPNPFRDLIVLTGLAADPSPPAV